MRRGGEKWFVSIQTEREVEEPVHLEVVLYRRYRPRGSAVCDHREVIQPCNPLQSKQARLKRYQRMMARRVKFTAFA